MPHAIQNRQLYADRTVQDWHRMSFPASDWAIDLDLMGACHRCRCPIYVIEATTNPNKPTTILLELAKRAALAAVVIFHDTATITSGRMIYPQRLDLRNESEVREHLAFIRMVHMQTHHGVA